MPAAIWLQPHGQQQQMLQGLIAALAKQHGTAPFRPHLTVCSAPDWDPAKRVAATDYFRRGALLPLTVRKAGISYSTTTPLRAVVIDIENNSQFGAFREALHRIVGATDSAPPHITLLYTIDERGTRPEWWSSNTRLRSIALECATLIETTEFVLDNPVVVASDGDWTNIKSWRVVSRFEERDAGT